MGDREAGVVKWFNDKKGYGFISRQSGGDIFVHHSSIVAEGFRSLKEGDEVEFEVKEDVKGKSAVEVKKV
ncbi:MAG TPA: cold shock domain-containing protein [Syntrophales bacterium]|jgi:CspA family cold shock protein|nr:cold shock domain-containing protein [Syntrophales bacterium]HPX56941.1 cold shock domain-containing protein [Syntrophales bacterium]HQA83617.1 cold shock domain-containing protein [Syntrophales bacterium]